MEDPKTYPRPPKLDPSSKRVRVVWHGNGEAEEVVIVDTTRAVRVLETNHPPAWYLPPEDVKMDLLKVHEDKTTHCPWKGDATYYDLVLPSSNTPAVESRIWSYHNPIPDFKELKGFLAFYPSSSNQGSSAGGWKAYVDDEEVHAEANEYYGGWYTRDVIKN
ncbi:DUF427-domain-containing protein [Atractiella rhizophila]|nr:DUF427-domain-containing protein [Atractiella rhizophila]